MLKRKNTIKEKILMLILAITVILAAMPNYVYASSDSKTVNCGSNGVYGTLTSNVWRGNKTKSGNTIQWDYQVSAVYKGNYTVKEIRTTWYSQASLKSSASISIGVGDSVSASSSSSYQTVSTGKAYWSNTNGAKSASYRSNIAIGPKKYYKSNTICTFNTAKVTLKISSSNISYTYTSSV